MGIYVSCALSLTTAFPLTYVCTILWKLRSSKMAGVWWRWTRLYFTPWYLSWFAHSAGETTTGTMCGEERQATKASGGNPALLVAFVGGGVISTKMIRRWRRKYDNDTAWDCHLLMTTGWRRNHGPQQRCTVNEERLTATNGGQDKRRQRPMMKTNNSGNEQFNNQLSDDKSTWQLTTTKNDDNDD